MNQRATIANSVNTINQLVIQETYNFKINSSFKKTRVIGGVVTTASGFFRIVTLSDGKYLELFFKENNGTVNSCDTKPVEILRIESNDLLSDTMSACGRVEFKYKRVN